jgi:ABC-type spermidine/putrescine transport system permease subunit I
MGAVKRVALAFGHFWWEFLIGENPDAFIGTLVIIGAALLLRHDRPAAIAIVPLLTLGVLVTSTYRGRKRVVKRPD